MVEGHGGRLGEEAHKAAQKTVYGRLPKVAAGAPVPIGAAYEKKADR